MLYNIASNIRIYENIKKERQMLKTNKKVLNICIKVFNIISLIIE